VDIRKKLFATRMVRHWNMFPREAADIPSLDVFTVKLDGALSSTIYRKMSLPMAGGLD